MTRPQRNKSYSWFPERLISCDRYLQLDAEADQLLSRLYKTCDRWGRFPAEPFALASFARILNPRLSALLEELEAAGFVATWIAADGNKYGALTRYDDDGAPLQVSRRRAPSRFPDPPRRIPGISLVNPPDSLGNPPDSLGSAGNRLGSSSASAITSSDSLVDPGDSLVNPPDRLVAPSQSPDPTSRSGGPTTPGAEARARVMDHANRDTRKSSSQVDREISARAIERATVDDPGREAFLAELRKRQQTPGALGVGRHSGGFFGPNGLDELERVLDSLLERSPRLYGLALEGFWPAWDSTRRGPLPRNVPAELERYAVEACGVPNVLSTLLAEAH